MKYETFNKGWSIGIIISVIVWKYFFLEKEKN